MNSRFPPLSVHLSSSLRFSALSADSGFQFYLVSCPLLNRGRGLISSLLPVAISISLYILISRTANIGIYFGAISCSILAAGVRVNSVPSERGRGISFLSVCFSVFEYQVHCARVGRWQQGKLRRYKRFPIPHIRLARSRFSLLLRYTLLSRWSSVGLSSDSRHRYCSL